MNNVVVWYVVWLFGWLVDWLVGWLCGLPVGWWGVAFFQRLRNPPIWGPKVARSDVSDLNFGALKVLR